MKHLQVFTDGSGTCFGHAGGWAYLILDVEDNLVIASGSGNCGSSTNNRMELTALLQGLKAAKSILLEKVAITIMSDSEYALGIAKGGWHPRKNQDLVEAIARETKNMTHLHFEHVKGHAGNPYNELVDRVANLQRLQVQSREENKND